jgi:hypothetical protein
MYLLLPSSLQVSIQQYTIEVPKNTVIKDPAVKSIIIDLHPELNERS